MSEYRLTPDWPPGMGGQVERIADNQTVYPDGEGWKEYQDWLAAGKYPQAAAEMPKPTQISTQAFFERFTDAERAAIWPASVANAALGVGLVHGLANGSINLLGADAKAWLDGLVAAKVITADRVVEILTP